MFDVRLDVNDGVHLVRSKDNKKKDWGEKKGWTKHADVN